jgi:hypothetical protein
MVREMMIKIPSNCLVTACSNKKAGNGVTDPRKKIVLETATSPVNKVLNEKGCLETKTSYKNILADRPK